MMRVACLSFALVLPCVLGACGTEPAAPPPPPAPEVPVPPGYEVVDIELPASVAGTVTAAGEPLAGASILVRGLSSGCPWPGEYAGRKGIDWSSEGMPGSTLLWPAACDLQVSNKDGKPHKLTLVAKTPTGFDDHPIDTISLDASINSSKWVTLPEGLLELREGDQALTIVANPSPYVAFSDAQGRYRLADLPPGKHQLEVWHPDHAPMGFELRIDVDLAANEALALDLTLR